jgi:hypothetical protein
LYNFPKSGKRRGEMRMRFIEVKSGIEIIIQRIFLRFYNLKGDLPHLLRVLAFFYPFVLQQNVKFSSICLSIPKITMLTKRAALIFSITDKVGGLQDALSIIKKHNLNMTRIESRPSKDEKWDYDFFVDFQDVDEKLFANLVEELDQSGYGATTVTVDGSSTSGSSVTSQVTNGTSFDCIDQ